jgi:hypothetical protein
VIWEGRARFEMEATSTEDNFLHSRAQGLPFDRVLYLLMFQKQP